MDVARLRRARQLFEEMLDLPAHQRKQALRLAATGDDTLLDMVQRLLIADSEAESGGELTGELAIHIAGAVATEDDAPLAFGAWVGPDARDGSAGRYEVDEELGKGSGGRVYRVRDRDLRRFMAMKVLNRGRTDRHGTLFKRFIQEARVTARLDHPAIVPVHELGRLADGRLYYTMKEVRGASLDLLTKSVHAASGDVWGHTEDGWTLRRLVSVIHRVCQAVAFAHHHGVVHRDLKPEHVVVADFGEVLVVDWGIALVLGKRDRAETSHDGDSARQTLFGAVMGTPAFMAPEQARGETHLIDRRTDVYALGALLAFVLTGAPPVAGHSSKEVVQRAASGHRVPLVARRDGPVLPRRLVAIAESALARDPNERPPDARALAAALHEWLAGEERHAESQSALTAASMARRGAAKLRRKAAKLRAEGQLADAQQQDLLADVQDLRFEQAVAVALSHDPQVPEAHLALAIHYTRRLGRAAERQDARELRLSRHLAREHLAQVPPDWPGRQRLSDRLDTWADDS